MPGKDSVLGKRKQRGNNKGQEHSPSSTLFVSNLPYNATSTDLQTLFSDFSPIRLAFVVFENGASKGVGYVSFAIKEDAKSTMERIAKERVMMDGRKLRVQWAEHRKNKGSRPVAKKAKSERTLSTNVQRPSDPELADESESEAEEADKSVLIESEKEHSGEDDGGGEDEEGSEEDESEDDSSSNHDSGESEDGSSVSSAFRHDTESEPDEGPVSGEDEERKPRKPVLPSTDEGTTIFIRNVPFDATEDEIRQLFRTFGALRYARITMDAETGRSRGTAFVCFWKKEDADRCIHQSELLNRETAAQQHEQSQHPSKKNPFSMPSLLTPDPSSSLAQSLVLHGRTLNVVRALSRDAAGRLAEEGRRSREKQNTDKRNTYLLREGVIFPNSPAASSLPPAEVEKRQASYTARCKLLKSNPVLYVSKTRLSVRQLPLFMTDSALKRLALHAVKAFEEEMKEGKREPLSAEELREDASFGGEANSDKFQASASKKFKRRKGRLQRKEFLVKQAKVVRQADRVDHVTGKGRSRGYAFLEMRSHADALRVLRYANNNPDVLTLLVGWWKAELRELIQKEIKKGQGRAQGTHVSAKQKQQGRKMPASKVDHVGNEDADDEEAAVAAATTMTMARLNRMKVELEELESGSQHRKVNSKSKTLIIEFSVENAQVIKQRQERQQTQKDTSIAQRRTIKK